jgi:amino acid adenylation domain-containing protein
MSQSEILSWDIDNFESTVPARFEEVVRHSPDFAAVIEGDNQITFAELDAVSDRVKHAILARSTTSSAPTVILTGHNSTCITAVLAALKAGKFYVVLDPGQPVEWLSSIFEDINPELVLFNSTHEELAREITHRETIRLLSFDDISETNSGNSKLKTREILPDDPAAIFYTSGSTGPSKGVVLSHSNLLQRACNALHRGQISPGKRILAFTPFFFGLTTSTFYGSLLNGGSIVILDQTSFNLADLPKIIQKWNISSIMITPSMIRAMSIEGHPSSNLDYIGIASERLYRKDLQKLRAWLAPDTLIQHMLGSTEIGGSHSEINLDSSYPNIEEIVPAGFPAPGYEISILDDHGSEVPIGQVGEIAARSPHLPLGFWNRPEQTAAIYLPDPQGGRRRICLTGDLGRIRPDGSLQFLGRKDSMVKVRGYRIDLEFVEAALQSLDEIKTAAVIAQVLDHGDQRLVAYIVPEDGNSFSTANLRKNLSRILPGFMVPEHFIPMTELPLTTNKKVDRRSLPLPGNSRPELDVIYTPPATNLERRLCEIWAEVLGLDKVGIHDPFLELGGQSLMAVRIVNRIYREFNVEISLESLIKTATVTQMAAMILLLQASSLENLEIENMLDELEGSSNNQS